MPKRTRKLLVYLDQNFLSAMAKADTHQNVNPAFNDIYELLHQGFVNEKVVVPASVLHDIESSLDTRIKDRIAIYQGYLGQVRLRRPDEVWNRQVDAVLCAFSERSAKDPLDPDIAFLDDPDQKVQRLGIRVDGHLERFNFRTARHDTARRLEALRQRLLAEGVGFEQQLEVEEQEQRDEFLRFYFRHCQPPSDEDRQRFTAFTESPTFRTIPLPRIQAHLFAAILTRKPTRAVRSGDAADIEILSAYAPYMDVVCTDAFMADQLLALGFDAEFATRVFHAKKESLCALKLFIERELCQMTPIRRPSITVFVLPPKDHRDQASAFFRQLGASARAMGTAEYCEIFAFDDGAMSRNELARLPGNPLPFYGLQDVTRLELPVGARESQILALCRAHCRSEHFMLIDEYRNIRKTFMVGAAMGAESGFDSSEGYRLFKTHP